MAASKVRGRQAGMLTCCAHADDDRGEGLIN